MKKVLAGLLAGLLFLSGCAKQPTQTRYEASFLTLFDTVTTMVGYGETKEAFQEQAQWVHDRLEFYHQRFDIYNEYEGIANLKVVNDLAGAQPVAVDATVMDLLLFCKEAYDWTNGSVNVAMGSVLAFWHDARERAVDDPPLAKLPDQAALDEAALHTNLDDVLLNQEDSTVYFLDPLLKLDVGAVAKGYAVEQVCREMEQRGMDNWLLSVGGNVRAVGAKPGGTAWTVGIENALDPSGAYLTKVQASDDLSVVTSGRYQRYFTVDGKQYHHIIDPQTLFPAEKLAGVSILCRDSGVADALSTALFCMSQEDGQALLDQVGEAEAVWVFDDGTTMYSPGFAAFKG